MSASGIDWSKVPPDEMAAIMARYDEGERARVRSEWLAEGAYPDLRRLHLDGGTLRPIQPTGLGGNMNLAYLKASRLNWIRSERWAKARHTAAVASNDTARVKKWGDRLRECRANIAKRDKQIAAKASGPAGTYAGSPVPGQRPVPSTHQTAGLPGYPAVDYFAKAGTPCVSPVTGTVARLSGHDPAGGPTGGVHGPFGWSVYIEGGGKTYYLTHMGSRTVRAGQSVRQGEKIGTVGNYARWGGTDHIHQGVHG